jgi:hypothetical protein
LTLLGVPSNDDDDVYFKRLQRGVIQNLFSKCICVKHTDSASDGTE